MVSFPDLWRAQPEHFAQTAARWERFGVTLGTHHNELARLTATVGAGWQGAARDAAITYLSGLAERIAGDRALAEQIPSVLHDHCRTVAAAQRLLHDAVVVARQSSITVSPDGSVGIVPPAAALALLTSPVLAALIAQARMIAEAIGQALHIATESDEQTAAKLAALTPGLGEGVPTGGSVPGSPQVPPAGTSPQQVSRWWNGLTSVQRQELIHTHPHAIGNLDGIPAQARDTANRLRLPEERAALVAHATRLQATAMTGDLSAAVQLGQVRDKLRALDAIEDTLARGDRQLLLLDTSGRRVKAAVAIGNVDTADHVAVLTPGFTATVEGSLPGYDDKMRLLRTQAQDEARRWGDGGSVATVTWIGYDAPQWGEIAHPGRSVTSEAQARGGGAVLGGFLDGIDAARPHDDPHLTAIGHSYGSTTTGHAGQHADAIDDMIFYGSPGIGTCDVRDLQVAEGHSYVIEARDDPVADLGRFGDDPNQLDGLTDLYSGAARSPDGRELTEVTGHSNYLAPDSTSQYNMSVVVAGLAERAVAGENAGIGDHTREFLDDAGDVIDGAADRYCDLVPGS